MRNWASLNNFDQSVSTIEKTVSAFSNFCTDRSNTPCCKNKYKTKRK